MLFTSGELLVLRDMKVHQGINPNTCRMGTMSMSPPSKHHRVSQNSYAYFRKLRIASGTSRVTPGTQCRPNVLLRMSEIVTTRARTPRLVFHLARFSKVETMLGTAAPRVPFSFHL